MYNEMIFGVEKEKVYSRQYSAPILKRKSSRFGLGQLLGGSGGGGAVAGAQPAPVTAFPPPASQSANNNATISVE